MLESMGLIKLKNNYNSHLIITTIPGDKDVLSSLGSAGGLSVVFFYLLQYFFPTLYLWHFNITQ